MVASTHDPIAPLTPAQVETWLVTARAKALQLHAQAQEPLYSTQREQTIQAMSALLQEAFEEVRVVSEALREASQATRARSTALCQRATALLTTAEAIALQHEAERRMLQMFMPERMQPLQPEAG